MRIGKEEDTGDVEGDEVASLKGFSRGFFFFFLEDDFGNREILKEAFSGF